MFRNFIWDFDGTLFDSYPHIVTAFCRTLEKYGIAHTYEEVYLDLCISFFYASDKYGLSPAQKQEFLDLNADHSLTPPVVPFPGAVELLRDLRAAGGRHFLYSHSTTEKVNFYYDKYDLRSLFTESVTVDYGFAHKPDPEGVRYLRDKYGLLPEDTLMIGDRSLDVDSGKGAGIPGCLITWGRPPQTETDYTVTDLSELRRLLLG